MIGNESFHFHFFEIGALPILVFTFKTKIYNFLYWFISQWICMGEHGKDVREDQTAGRGPECVLVTWAMPGVPGPSERQRMNLS